MCCSDDKFAPGDCKCHSAVLKAYRTLLGAGQPEKTALSVAKRVYRFHHPEHRPDDAALTVERWVNEGHFH
ncbi:MAG: hypothetical protein ACT4OY_07170 [Alphaproteobacteria bacterium]